MQFPCSTSVHRISFDIKDIHQKSQLSRVTKTIVPEKHVTCIIDPWRTGVNEFQEQLGAVRCINITPSYGLLSPQNG